MLNQTTRAVKPRAPFPLKTKDGRTAGYFDPATRTHNRTWDKRKHLSRKHNAIGYDMAILEELERLGCKILENEDRHDGVMYFAPLAEVLERGTRDNLGWGLQVFLPLEHWVRQHADGRVVRPEPKPVQMGLFEGVTA